MAGRKRVTDEDFEMNKKMIEIGREQGALEAEEARKHASQLHEIGVMTGRVQGFKAMRLLAEYLEFKQMAEIVATKKHLKIPGVSSITEYFEYMNISPSTGYNNLLIGRKLQADELQFFAAVGLTRKDLLGYASLPDEVRMEIRDGKVINLEKADREDVREVIEQLLLEKKQAEDESEKKVKAIERVKDQKQAKIDAQENEIASLTEKLEAGAIPRDEVGYCKRIDELDIRMNVYLAEIRGVVECDVPGPTAAMKLIALLNRLRMEANHWYQDAYDVHGPADAAPEEEWQQPDNSN